MKTINLLFSGKHLEVHYEVSGLHIKIVKVLDEDGKDFLPRMDLRSFMKLRKKINKLEF